MTLSEARAVQKLWLVQRGEDALWTWWTYFLIAHTYEHAGDGDAALAEWGDFQERLQRPLDAGISSHYLDKIRYETLWLMQRLGQEQEAARLESEWGVRLPTESDPSPAVKPEGE